MLYKKFEYLYTAYWVKIAADDTQKILFFPENRVCHYMQIVSIGDNLYEMSYLIFWEK